MAGSSFSASVDVDDPMESITHEDAMDITPDFGAASNPSSGFLDILDRDNAYDALFAHCTPATIHCISRTCRLARQAALDYNSRAYDIVRFLLRFFKNPIAFRCMQARTGSVISGSLALQFLERSFYPESDCDLYVTWEDAVEVCKWIMSPDGAGKGYVFAPRETQAPDIETAIEIMKESWAEIEDDLLDEEDLPYPAVHMTGVFSFVPGKESAAAKYPTKLQMIVARTNPIDVITKFHSTVVMNAISYKAAYCFFPRATFEERKGAICCNSRRPRQKVALDKYRDRGWDFSQNAREAPDPEFKFLFQLHETRWVGDKYCWTLPLDTKDIVDDTSKYLALGYEPRSFNRVSIKDLDPFTFNGWTMTWANMKQHYFLLTDQVRKPYFKFHYHIPFEGRRSTRLVTGALGDIKRALKDEFPKDVFFDIELLKALKYHHLCSCPVTFCGETGEHRGGVSKHRGGCEVRGHIDKLYEKWPKKAQPVFVI